MGRKKTGSVYTKDGSLWYSFALRSGRRWTKRVPPLPNGRVATEEEARTYLAEALRRYELGLWDPEAPSPVPPSAPLPPPVPTVAEYAESWLKGQTHASKFNEELIFRRHLANTDLGRMKMTEVAPQHVATWVRALRATPSSKGGLLAPQTVRAFYGALRKLYVSAVFERVVPSTPCVMPPGVLPTGSDKVPGARRKWRYSRDELEQLISDVRIPEARRVLWAVLFCAGLRAGEAFALKWSDYDTSRSPLGCLSIDRAWSSKHKLEKETKTKATRSVPVHLTLAAILAEWKLSGWQRQHGRAPKDDDLIVPNEDGAARSTGNAWRSLGVDSDRLEIPRRRLHGMRHTFISLAIDDGARSDIIIKITHTRPQRTSFDAYREEAWETLCAEVAKLQIRRRADVLPLWKVASSGGGGASNSATDSATSTTSPNGNIMPQVTSEHHQSDLVDDRLAVLDEAIDKLPRVGGGARDLDAQAGDLTRVTARLALPPNDAAHLRGERPGERDHRLAHGVHREQPEGRDEDPAVVSDVTEEVRVEIRIRVDLELDLEPREAARPEGDLRGRVGDHAPRLLAVRRLDGFVRRQRGRGDGLMHQRNRRRRGLHEGHRRGRRPADPVAVCAGR